MVDRASETGGLDHLSDALDSFRCCKDKDIENFLRKNALHYLERGWCSVYLILDEQEFNEGHIKVIAYFTLSHKSLVPENVSKVKIKNTGGFKDAKSIHFVLIGQLGKYIDLTKNGHAIAAQISGREILDYAFEIINESSELIPCRCALVECSAKEKVQKIYLDYDFSFFQYDGEHYQFYKRI